MNNKDFMNYIPDETRDFIHEVVKYLADLKTFRVKNQTVSGYDSKVFFKSLIDSLCSGQAPYPWESPIAPYPIADNLN